MAFKAVLNYKDGELISVDDNASDVIDISILEGIKIKISPETYQNKVSGSITINVDGEKVKADFSQIEPQSSAKLVQSSLDEIYTVE